MYYQAEGDAIDINQVDFIDDELIDDATYILAFLDLFDIDSIFNDDLLRARYAEYIAANLFTTDEQKIRYFLADSCGILWEPDGQFLFMLWTDDGMLQFFLDNLDTNPDDICDIAQTVLDYFQD
jgi:hypothetical protein